MVYVIHMTDSNNTFKLPGINSTHSFRERKNTPRLVFKNECFMYTMRLRATRNTTHYCVSRANRMYLMHARQPQNVWWALYFKFSIICQRFARARSHVFSVVAMLTAHCYFRGIEWIQRSDGDQVWVIRFWSRVCDAHIFQTTNDF